MEKYYAFDTYEDFEEAVYYGGVTLLWPLNASENSSDSFYIYEDGRGVNVQEQVKDKPETYKTYQTLTELIKKYVFPDGTKLKDTFVFEI